MRDIIAIIVGLVVLSFLIGFAAQAVMFVIVGVSFVWQLVSGRRG